MRRPILLPLALGAAAALVLAGCAKDGSQSDTSSSPEDLYQPGPLDEYLSVMWEGQDWSEEKAKEQDRQREDLIAKCMSEQGFEYIPNTGNTFYSSSEDEVDGPAWGTLEYAEQYGYGVVDYPGREEMESQQPGEEEYVDPNQDYIDSLSEAEQQAFSEALWGVQPELSEEDWSLIDAGEMEYPEINLEDQGCFGAAQQQLDEGSAAGMWNDPEFADLTQAMNAMYEEQMSDPEWTTLDTEWVNCMAESGFPGLKSKDDAMNAIWDKQNELYSQGADGEWQEPSKEQLDEFQKAEIEQAVADHKCTEKIDYYKKVSEINHRWQQDFLDQHKAELDAAIAKYGKTDDKS